MKIKFPYGTTAENNALTLPVGQLSVDLDRKALRFHDGVTPGGFEAVGVQAYFEPAGYTWGLVDYGAARGILRVEYYDGEVFICLNLSTGSLNTLYRSTDGGVTWTGINVNPGVTHSTRTLVKNGNTLIAGGSGGDMYISTDNGTTWGLVATPVTTYAGLHIVYWKGLYIYLSGTSSCRITTSSDGVTWTSRLTIASNGMQRMAYSDNLIVAVGSNGRLYSSPDGITWTQRTTPFNSGNHIRDVVYAAGVFVIVGTDRKVYQSVDAITWTVVTFTGMTPTDLIITAVAYVNELWLFGGDNKKLYYCATLGGAVTDISTRLGGTTSTTTITDIQVAGTKVFLGTDNIEYPLYRSPPP